MPRTTLHSHEIPSEANGWSGQNFTGYQATRGWTSCWTRSRSSSTGTSGPALWAELQRLYAEELPALPLFFRADAHIWPKWLEGVEPTGHMAPTTLVGRALAGRGRMR